MTYIIVVTANVVTNAQIGSWLNMSMPNHYWIDYFYFSQKKKKKPLILNKYENIIIFYKLKQYLRKHYFWF